MALMTARQDLRQPLTPLIASIILLALTASALAEGGYNLKVEIPQEYQRVAPGSDVYASLTLFNLDGQQRRDITIEYWITGPDGEFGRVQETLAIETQASLVRRVPIPDGKRDGQYAFQARILYGEGKEQLSATTFLVERPASPYKRLFPFAIAGVTIIALLIVMRMLKKPLQHALKVWRLRRKIRRIVRCREA